MLYKEPDLDEIIDEMRSIGEHFIPYNFPKTMPTLEDALKVFKEREVVIDGYPIILHYQKSDHDKHFMETLQIYCTSSPFLPFNVICKLGKRFLGSHHLSLIEIFQDGRKIYIWSVCVDDDGKPMPLPYDTETEECEFEGFSYLYMQPSQVDFFNE